MKQKKYLFYFRFQFPIDWVNEKDHEAEEFVFINAQSTDEALEWGNVIAEKFIENLSAGISYQNKIGFTSFIWDEIDNLSKEQLKESKEFPVVNHGEFPDRYRNL